MPINVTVTLPLEQVYRLLGLSDALTELEAALVNAVAELEAKANAAPPPLATKPDGGAPAAPAQPQRSKRGGRRTPAGGGDPAARAKLAAQAYVMRREQKLQYSTIAERLGIGITTVRRLARQHAEQHGREMP